MGGDRALSNHSTWSTHRYKISDGHEPPANPTGRKTVQDCGCVHVHDYEDTSRETLYAPSSSHTSDIYYECDAHHDQRLERDAAAQAKWLEEKPERDAANARYQARLKAERERLEAEAQAIMTAQGEKLRNIKEDGFSNFKKEVERAIPSKHVVWHRGWFHIEEKSFWRYPGQKLWKGDYMKHDKKYECSLPLRKYW